MDSILNIQHVSKKYRLGMIGGTTLRDELQRKRAKRKGIEDPTRLVTDQRDYSSNEEFMALDDINLQVKPGERLGIIGHNGAGKSTLLKLISRITAPTTGKIEINGRIASMLEVGTGFHPELTGRENVYMNGAILGMTRKEIDSKIEDIIDFSECRQFIDTPVKRYSSGMYVKLAFSVAVHLDSEIMIMDEVLAVGDMAFQKKCIDKMGQVSKEDGRTILYVSHNMNTIRTLCSRCIVLDHGKVIFNGDVEDAIAVYMGNNFESQTRFELDPERDTYASTFYIQMHTLNLLNHTNCIKYGEQIEFDLEYECTHAIEHLRFRFYLSMQDMVVFATSFSEEIPISPGKYHTKFRLDTSHLAPAKYFIKIIAMEPTVQGTQIRHDIIKRACTFEVVDENQLYNFIWDTRSWGNYIMPNAEIIHDGE